MAKKTPTLSQDELPRIKVGKERLTRFRHLGVDLGLSLAEMVRQAVDLYIENNGKKHAKKIKKIA